VVAWLVLFRIPAADAPISPQEPFSRKLIVPLRDLNIRRLILFYVMWNLAVNVAAPFIPVFYLQKLGLPFAYIMLLNTLNSVMGIMTTGFWTRLAQRFGIKPVVFVATLGDALVPLLLMFVDGPSCWLLAGIHLLGVFNAPIDIGPDSFILKLAPDRNASPYMAMFRAIIGPATAMAAILGGWLAGAWSESTLVIQQMNFSGLKIVFLISFLGRVASLALLAGVIEPEAHTLRYIVAVFRRSWQFRRARLASAGLVGDLHATQDIASRGGYASPWPPSVPTFQNAALLAPPADS
jgi:predicted MFS family arabinose efflux permease